MYHFEYPFPPQDVVDFFRTTYGPMLCAFSSLEIAGQGRLHEELVRLWSAHNTGGNSSTKVASEYLEIVAVR